MKNVLKNLEQQITSRRKCINGKREELFKLFLFVVEKEFQRQQNDQNIIKQLTTFN